MSSFRQNNSLTQQAKMSCLFANHSHSERLHVFLNGQIHNLEHVEIMSI